MRLAALLILASAVTAHAGEITIERRPTVDLKAVFATVESLHETQARARIGGTVSSLSVEEGQQVDAGQVIAGISDAKIALQTAGADARIASAESELQLARTEYQRATELLAVGAGTKSRLETARTKLEVAERTVTALRSERGVLAEHGGEGAVLAPNNGRVLKVRVTTGSVVLPGEAVGEEGRRALVEHRDGFEPRVQRKRKRQRRRTRAGSDHRMPQTALDEGFHEHAGPKGVGIAEVERDGHGVVREG